MKASDVYREAARLGAEGESDGSCIWIAWAQDKDAGSYFHDKFGEKFKELFKPEYGIYWGEQWADDKANPRQCPETRNCRVLALCFMAAIVERKPKQRHR